MDGGLRIVWVLLPVSPHRGTGEPPVGVLVDVCFWVSTSPSETTVVTPLPAAPWVFLFGLPVSCVLVWGARAETPQDSYQGLNHAPVLPSAAPNMPQREEHVPGSR